MVLFLLGLGVFVFFEYKDAKSRGFGWRELFGITKRLLLPPGPVPKCRACETELPDPILREELGHGAYVCLSCEREIREEAGLVLPKWFTDGKVQEGEVVDPDPLAAKKAALNKETSAIRVDDIKCDDWVNQHDGEHVAVGNYRPLAENFRPTGGFYTGTGELVCPEPRNNVRVEIDNPSRPHRRSVPVGETSPHTRWWCNFCQINHPFPGDCPWDD